MHVFDSLAELIDPMFRVLVFHDVAGIEMHFHVLALERIDEGHAPFGEGYGNGETEPDRQPDGGAGQRQSPDHADQHITDWKSEEALKMTENALTQNNDNIQAFIVSNALLLGAFIWAFAKDFNAALEQLCTRRDRENLARFGISANAALGGRPAL